jgi:Spy/CpxP family protein refolding chaperone
MKPKVLPVVLTVLIMAAGSSMALAYQGCWGPGWRGDPGFTSLTPDQQKKVDDLRIEFIKKTEGLRTQISKKRLELMELSGKSSPDQKALDKAEQELWALQDTLRAEYRTYDAKMAKIVPSERRRGFGYGGFGGYGSRYYCGDIMGGHMMGGPMMGGPWY